MSQRDLGSEVAATAERVLTALAQGRKTAWELKMQLKVSHTLLHLALGALLERKQVGLTPEKMTYGVEPLGTAAHPSVMTAHAQPSDSQPAASA